jgi:signal transduction histidine kinase
MSNELRPPMSVLLGLSKLPPGNGDLGDPHLRQPSRVASRARTDAVERLRSLSRRLMRAEEDERKRLGRELHDQVGANLSALVIGLALIRAELSPGTGALLQKRLAQLEETLHNTMQHVRSVLADLRPTALDELGLVSALRHQAGVLAASTGVKFLVSGREPFPRLGPEPEIALYRIAQEAWNNVLKHADAQSVTVTVQQRGGRAVMRIIDDGRGFDPDALVRGSPSLGIMTMRERADAVGALLEIDASEGSGTRVEVSLELPLRTREP